MENNYEKETLSVLSYFDIFSYPLTLIELIRYFPKSVKKDTEKLKKSLSRNVLITEIDGFYCLLGREDIIALRQEREEISISKMSRAWFFSELISKIPTVLLIGISGSLSMRNAQSGDDIDLFIITRKNTLWITRFLVTTVLFFFGHKRRKFETKADNKICTNMFLADDNLEIKKKDRNLYIAHEVAQLKTIYSRNKTYEKFFASNKWINKFFPNIEIVEGFPSSKNHNNILNFFFLPTEKIMFFIQKEYMKKHQTIEKISQNGAKFHPVDKNKIIMNMYKIRIKKNLYKYRDLENVDLEDVQFYFNNEGHQRLIN